MGADERIAEGDFRGALEILKQGPEEPSALLTMFNLQTRLEAFEDAQRSLARLVMLAPQLAGAAKELGGCARCEATLAMRRSDPRTAGARRAVGAPHPVAIGYAKASAMHASGDAAAAAQAIRETESVTARCPGLLTWSNGRQARFTHLADSDELTGSTVPCFVGEHVVDFAYDELRSITFSPGKASFDWLWMPADIEFAKKEAPLFGRIPALYSGAGIHPSNPVRTGQMTSWNRDHGYAIGEGQRDLYVHTEQGMMVVGLRQITRIEFDAKGPARTEDEKPKTFWQKLFS